MELKQLEYFLAVADHANFTRAAEALRVAQPWVSAQVRRLEGELGNQLFDRSSRVLRLTEVGRALLPLAGKAVGTVGEIRMTAVAMGSALCGQLTVGLASHPPTLFVDTLAAFHAIHPAVPVTLTDGTSEQLTTAVRERRLDMAVVGPIARPSHELCEQILTELNMVAIVRRDDPLASHTSVGLAALRNRALISHPVGSGLRELLDQACLARGFVPQIVVETRSVDLMSHLVLRDLGVAVALALPRDLSGVLRQIDLSDPALRGHLALIWRGKGASPEAVAFAAQISQMRAASGVPAECDSHRQRDQDHVDGQ